MTDQKTPLSELGLDDSLRKVLEGEPNSIGSVEQLLAIDDLTDLRGIGSVGASTIKHFLRQYEAAPGNESQVTDGNAGPGRSEGEGTARHESAGLADGETDSDAADSAPESKDKAATPPEPRYAVSSIFEIPVPIVISDAPAGYVSREVSLKLNREQTETLQKLLSGCRQTPELTTKAGKQIVSANDLFVFLLDVIGAQIPENQSV